MVVLLINNNSYFQRLFRNKGCINLVINKTILNQRIKLL